MIRLIPALCVLVGAFMLNACCCASGEPKPPKLRPLPQFQPVPAAPQIYYEK